MPYLAPKRCTICSQVLSMNWKRPLALPVRDLAPACKPLSWLAAETRKPKSTEVAALAWRMPRATAGSIAAAWGSGWEGAGMSAGVRVRELEKDRRSLSETG